MTGVADIIALNLDLLFQVAVLSFFFASICSWMVGTYDTCKDSLFNLLTHASAQ